jgi:hypothetical protein
MEVNWQRIMREESRMRVTDKREQGGNDEMLMNNKQ